MRIIAGKFKGRRLKVLKGSRIRPTSDRVREALFSILGDKVVGSRVLDLFAGSGALGLEALSRGAKEVVFVEKARAAREIIRDNIISLGLEKECEFVPGDYRVALERLGERGTLFDLMLVDPPYRDTEEGEAENILSQIGGSDTLRVNGLVVIEHFYRAKILLPDHSWKIIKFKKYGRSCLTILTGEWGMGNGEWGMGNGEWGMGR
ncbi:MAG: 16S rRNA (guanine(966)-N(2))-methyltransferase RsmD [Candidatus Auribacterota bacterium]|nr:16S rRNA (guanine(966)-N(2))-methyltransferase RsmD [Candidatus Auribacterota bacterium]